MKRWLVLVGGGGKGRWQAGALDALSKAGLLDGLAGIVGTSVGGINACLLGAGLAQGEGTGLLLAGWAAIMADESVYLPGLTAVAAAPLRHVFDDLGLARGFLQGPSPCSTAPLQALVKRFLGGWTTDMVEAKDGLVVRVRAFNYAAGRADTLKGDLAAMVLCTSAIEGVFPRQWGYGDGGAVDNEPLDVALDHGADQVLVVYCGPDGPEERTWPEITVQNGNVQPPSSTGLKDALAVLGGITAANEDLVESAAERAEAVGGVQVVHCYPVADTGSALDFSPRDLLARGRADAVKAIGEARALGWT